MKGLITCESGLFIGVNNYPTLPSVRHLRSACRDAASLAEMFRASRPDGLWVTLIEDAVQRPTRAMMIQRVREFARSVQPNSAGLLYFAGHAVNRPNGMILTCADFRPMLADDTGLPLARVLAILKSEAPHDCRFVLMLDCCRDGSTRSSPDDIPPHVCIIYAVHAHERAEETHTGGPLFRAICRSSGRLVETAAINGEQLVHNVLLSHVFDALQVGYGESSELYGPEPELAGSHADSILIPILSAIDVTTEREAARPPEATLHAAVGTRAEMDTLLNRLGVIHQLWQGGAMYKSVSTDISIREQINCDFDSLSLTFRLHPTPHDSALMSHLLHECRYDFRRVSIDWLYQVQSEVLMSLGKAVKGSKTITTKDSSHELIWENDSPLGRYRGIMWIPADNHEHATVELRCQTVDGHEMPLFFLLPSLSDVFRRLTHFRGG